MKRGPAQGPAADPFYVFRVSWCASRLDVPQLRGSTETPSLLCNRPKNKRAPSLLATLTNYHRMSFHPSFKLKPSLVPSLMSGGNNKNSSAHTSLRCAYCFWSHQRASVSPHHASFMDPLTDTGQPAPHPGRQYTGVTQCHRAT